ncbi:MAG TPA: hypothetical protein VIT64_18110 [Ilumatobacteraceae bacterium]
MNDDELLEQLRDALDRPVPPAPPQRIASLRATALRAQAEQATPAAHVADAAPAQRSSTEATFSRRTWILSGAAAAVVGAASGAVVANVLRDDPPSGPPTEAMSWSREPNAPDGLTLAGRTINHTWGVELLLDATGFEIGSAYRLVYVGVDGSRTDAGGFVGAKLPMACRSNAPVLRDALDSMEILDDDGNIVGRGRFV